MVVSMLVLGFYVAFAVLGVNLNQWTSSPSSTLWFFLYEQGLSDFSRCNSEKAKHDLKTRRCR